MVSIDYYCEGFYFKRKQENSIIARRGKSKGMSSPCFFSVCVCGGGRLEIIRASLNAGGSYPLERIFMLYES